MDINQGIAIALTISLLANLLQVVISLLTPLVKKMLRLRKTVLIGQGPRGVDVREKVVKGEYYTWKQGDDIGDVHIDPQLTDRTVDGRRVVWIDTHRLQQIQPVGDKQDEDAKKRWLQAHGYIGDCENDDDQTIFTYPNDKEPKRFTWPVWRRVTGIFLLQRRLDTRKKRMEDESGLLDVIAKVAPLVMILLMFLVLGLMFVMFTAVKASGGA